MRKKGFNLFLLERKNLFYIFEKVRSSKGTAMIRNILCAVHFGRTRWTIDFKSLRINEKGWRGTINMQRFLHFNYIFSRVEDERFALEFRGRARRVGALKRAGIKGVGKKRGKKNGDVRGNWENRREPDSKFHGNLKFLENEEIPPPPTLPRPAGGDRLIGSSVSKRGKSISAVPRMTSYKFSECNFARAPPVVSVEKYVSYVHLQKTNRSLRYCAP